MPVEVRELVIKAVVGDHTGGGSAGAGGSQEEIVAACVDEVLRILERKQQR